MTVCIRLLLLTNLLGCTSLVQGARILAVIPLPIKSHHRFTQPLLKALAKAGHEVVVYSPYPLDEPQSNYTNILVELVASENSGVDNMAVDYTKKPYYKCVDIFFEALDMALVHFINSDNINKLLKSKERFDLVMTEIFCGQEFSLILGHIFKAPVIGLQPYMTSILTNSNLGNTLSVSYIPDICSPFGTRMSFIERLLNSLFIARGMHYVYHQKYLPLVKDKLKQYFPDAPPLLEMINNISLVFVNDHLTADYARPRTPNIIPVAGIHIQDQKPLPQNIQQFMDGATDGVILFSMGSTIPDELQPKEYFDMFNYVFRQLSQRVLWKTRKENIQGLSDNVMTIKWAPQQDILAHPNCVLFITHGGQLSQHEAIHTGVPVVSVPHFFDQHRNAKFYEELGIGIRLGLKEMSKSTILSAVRKVLDDPQYANNMKRLSRVYRDRPMTPAETVVYWTEYVLRHGGSHLRPASTELSWYQLALLDVIGVIFVAIISVVLITYLILRRIFQYIYGNVKNTPLKKKIS